MDHTKVRLQHMERILEVSRELAVTTSLEDLLHQIIEIATDLTNSQSASIMLLNESTGDLRLVAAKNLVDQLIDIPVPIDRSIAGASFSSGEPIIVPDVHADPRYYGEVDRLIGIEGRSLLAVPLQFKDLRIGVLETENKRDEQAYDQQDVNLLTALATQATVAIENARLYVQIQKHRDHLGELVNERTGELETAIGRLENEITIRARTEKALRQRNRALALLNQVGQQLTATLDMQRIAKKLQQVGSEIIGAESASVWLLDPQREGWLTCWTVVRDGQEHSPLNMQLHPGQGIAGWVIQTGKPAVIPHAPDDPRFFSGVDEQLGFHTLSLLAVPLRVRDRVIGVLEIVNKLQGEFNADDLALAETLAASTAISIDNARLVEALHLRTAELQAQNEELDAFAHSVAHDLKSPLTSISLHAQWAEAEYATMPEAELCESLQLITRGTTKISSIIDELLLLASVRKMQEIRIAVLDMPRIVAEARGRLDLLIRQYHAQIIVPPASTWPKALGYGPWIEEVWINYISNACKYGGNRPTVEVGFDVIEDPRTSETEAGSLGPSSSGHGSQVRFWVHDNGAGLSTDDQSLLFAPFTRLYQVRVKGHGLGLSIVQRIVEKLGGQVGVESDGVPGRGSTFYFTLPAAQD